MQLRWQYKEQPDAEAVKALAGQINVHSVLATLLLQRGISTFEQAKAFFRPSLAHLHDPFAMKDMDRAVNRLAEALHNHEPVMVYGDYDVDGTTSVALVYGFLSQFHEQLHYYIPDRYKEGYGVSKQGIDQARDKGVGLLLTLDCGIKAYEEIDYARQQGIDVIVCDHHTPEEPLPEAFAVLDPKRNDCEYPYKALSGCGVGFKLLQAFCQQMSIPEAQLHQLLDLVAVSIAADIVPLTGENRVLAYFGLEKLNDNPLPGLQALMDVADLKKPLNVSNVVFGIAPRINAAGRIKHGGAAVDLLLASHIEEAGRHAQQVNQHNSDRQGIDRDMTREALAFIDADEQLQQACTTVLYKEDWHKGVVGIVASRCMETYYRPTVILTQSNGKIMGSARSVAGFNLYEAMHACSDLLEQFGGHRYAAGLSLLPENLEAFREKFEAIVRERITEDMLVPSLEIDSELRLAHVNSKFYNILRQMAPFGPDNPRPLFVSKGVFDTGKARVLKEKHLKLNLRQQDSLAFDAIGFNMAEHYENVSEGQPFDVCYTLEENVYNGVHRLQLNLKDIKPGNHEA